MFQKQIVRRAAMFIWLIGIGTSLIQAASFQPSVTMLGLMPRLAVGETIEWVVSFSNAGEVAGENILLTNTVGEGLQIESVRINTGTTAISGRTIAVTMPSIAPDETVQYRIYTTITSTSNLNNVVCVTAANFSGENCVRGLPVQALPDTGETLVWWRRPLLWMGVLLASVFSLMTGVGLLGYQTLNKGDQTPA